MLIFSPVLHSKFTFLHKLFSDMSTMIWDCNVQRVINKFDNHTEFVVGLDFNLFVEKQLASSSWDKSCAVFRYDDNPKLLMGK